MAILNFKMVINQGVYFSIVEIFMIATKIPYFSWHKIIFFQSFDTAEIDLYPDNKRTEFHPFLQNLIDLNFAYFYDWLTNIKNDL